jgi:uncharacterized protein (UPF0332 family)
MVSTEKVLFSLQMSEESFQEVQLLFKDGKTRSLLNSLYNVYYYGMEAILQSLDVHCRSHSELKKNFIALIRQKDLFDKTVKPISTRWDQEIETIFEMKSKNEKGFIPSDSEVQRLIQTGEQFLKGVKNYLLI